MAVEFTAIRAFGTYTHGQVAKPVRRRSLKGPNHGGCGRVPPVWPTFQKYRISDKEFRMMRSDASRLMQGWLFLCNPFRVGLGRWVFPGCAPRPWALLCNRLYVVENGVKRSN